MGEERGGGEAHSASLPQMCATAARQHLHVKNSNRANVTAVSVVAQIVASTLGPFVRRVESRWGERGLMVAQND